MRPLCLTLLGVFGLGLATMEARAESWPAKPLRAIVPVGAGSTTDIIPRVVFEQLSAQLGQSIVVENRVERPGGRSVPPSSPKRIPMATLSSPTAPRSRSRRRSIRTSATTRRGISLLSCHSESRPTSWSFHRPRAGGQSAISSPEAKARPGALNFSSVGMGAQPT